MSKQMGAPSCFQRETTFMTSYLLPGKLSRSKLVSAIKEKNFFQGAKSFLNELISVKKDMQKRKLPPSKNIHFL